MVSEFSSRDFLNFGLDEGNSLLVFALFDCGIENDWKELFSRVHIIELDLTDLEVEISI